MHILPRWQIYCSHSYPSVARPLLPLFYYLPCRLFLFRSSSRGTAVPSAVSGTLPRKTDGALAPLLKLRRNGDPVLRWAPPWGVGDLRSVDSIVKRIFINFNKFHKIEWGRTHHPFFLPTRVSLNCQEFFFIVAICISPRFYDFSSCEFSGWCTELESKDLQGRKDGRFVSETGSGSVRGINSMTGLFDRAIMCESIAARRGYETRGETWRTEE